MIISAGKNLCLVAVVVFFYASLSMQFDTARVTLSEQRGGDKDSVVFEADDLKLMDSWLGLWDLVKSI